MIGVVNSEEARLGVMIGVNPSSYLVVEAPSPRDPELVLDDRVQTAFDRLCVEVVPRLVDRPEFPSASDEVLIGEVVAVLVSEDWN